MAVPGHPRPLAQGIPLSPGIPLSLAPVQRSRQDRRAGAAQQAVPRHRSSDACGQVLSRPHLQAGGAGGGLGSQRPR